MQSVSIAQEVLQEAAPQTYGAQFVVLPAQVPVPLHVFTLFCVEPTQDVAKQTAPDA